MTTTALVALNGNHQLTEMQQAILAEATRLEEATAFHFEPTRITMPSGKLAVFSLSDGELLQPGFTAIIAVAQMKRSWWSTKEPSEQPPLCSSWDGLQGWLTERPDKEQLRIALMNRIKHHGLERLDNYRGPFDCKACALSQWGSANDGNDDGQACKDLRQLLLLVDGWQTPAILTLPPTSGKPFDRYASARSRKPGESYFSVRTRFDLEPRSNGKGATYSVIKLSAAGALTDEQASNVLVIRAQYAELVRRLEVTAEDYQADQPF